VNASQRRLHQCELTPGTAVDVHWALIALAAGMMLVVDSRHPFTWLLTVVCITGAAFVHWRYARRRKRPPA
jgi:hypothetical protein